jgi:mRNA-degrading endonuclease toxin of MazEF toxin-antitoxin module
VRVRRRKNKAMAHQIKTVSKTRVLKRVGRATRSEMEQIDRAIQIQLGLLT